MFRIATYNIRYGGTGRLDLLLKVLISIEADAILLTEASNDEVLRQISSEMEMEYVKTEGTQSHLAFLSRVPILDWNSYCPKYINRALLEIRLAFSPHQEIAIYGLHLQCHYFSWNERQRLLELDTYLQYIKSRKPSSHLLLGDFNAVAPGDKFDRNRLPLKEKLMLGWERGRTYHDAIQKLHTESYVDCFRRLHPGEDGFTLPTGMPHVRLDYVFADPLLAASLKDCAVVTSPDETVDASDHYPLAATFEL